MGFGGFGETLPYHDNRMWLDRDKRDKWDLPIVVFDHVKSEIEIVSLPRGEDADVVRMLIQEARAGLPPSARS